MKKKKGLNAIVLNHQASDVLAAQRQMIEQALGMHEKPKKLKDVNKLIAKWRTTSGSFWPEDTLQHKMLPLAKSVFSALQTVQQISLWVFDEDKIPDGKHAARDKQVMQLHAKWIEQISKLPALPLISTGGNKLLDQVNFSTEKAGKTSLAAVDVLQMQPYWLDLMVVYWTFIAGQIMKPKTFAEAMEGEA